MSKPNVNVANGLGSEGSLYIADTNPHEGPFRAVQACETTVADLSDGNMAGPPTAVDLVAGMVVGGHFRSVTLASGSVIAYY